jgi:hypothetical protein
VSFIIEAKVEALLALTDEAFDEALYTEEAEVIEAIGYGRVYTPAATYAEGRASVIAYLRERKVAVDGIYGAKALFPLPGGLTEYAFIYEKGQA